MTDRVNPTRLLKRALYEANANRCCVCKRSDVGLHLHHIDGNPSNTLPENLAVLCVEDHDRHHRPTVYKVSSKHVALGPEAIRQFKSSWEAFVKDARRPSPSVLATLTFFGTVDHIHSAELVLQWPDERIIHTHPFHLRQGTFEDWLDDILKDLKSISPTLSLACLDEPQPPDLCPCCRIGLSHTIKPPMVRRLTDPDWSSKSILSVFVNPNQPSLAVVVGLGDEHLFSASLHLCQRQRLHFMSDFIEESFPITRKPSVRTQAMQIIEALIQDWKPAHILIGTGDHDHPSIIKDFELPRCWEKRH